MYGSGVGWSTGLPLCGCLWDSRGRCLGRTLMGAPNGEPQEYRRNIVGTFLPEALLFLLYAYYILRVPCLGFPLRCILAGA